MHDTVRTPLRPYIEEQSVAVKDDVRHILLGLEHEYCLKDGSKTVDFSGISLAAGQARCRLDPRDPNAIRTSGGLAVTSDQAEAEVVLPPVSLKAGFADRTSCANHLARSLLKSLLTESILMEGYSTHFSVSVPSQINELVALVYNRSFAPAMMLLTDRVDSPGLLVRPRPNRLELCGEYVEGIALRAAAAFAAGSVLAGLRAVLDGSNATCGFPFELRVKLAPDSHRYGWYVDRRAFGNDLYTRGRATKLPLARGGYISAQEHLETCWEVARKALAGYANEDDLWAADQMVSGKLPLPCEGLIPVEERPPPVNIGTTAHGAVLKPRKRPGFELAPVMATWDVTVFLIANKRRTRRAFACVPRDFCSRFMIQLLRGELDEAINSYLRKRPSGRRLERYEQTFAPGLYDELGPRRHLLPLERAPMTWEEWQKMKASGYWTSHWSSNSDSRACI